MTARRALISGHSTELKSMLNVVEHNEVTINVFSSNLNKFDHLVVLLIPMSFLLDECTA